MRFAVIGDIMVDRTIHGEVNKISPEAPIPVLNVKYETQTLGGAGNVVKNLTAMGHQVMVSGFMGPLAKELFKADSLINYGYTKPRKKDNVKLRYVDIKTGYHLVRVDDEDEIISYGPMDTRSIEKHFQHLDGIILSDYCKGCFGRVTDHRVYINKNNVAHLIKEARKHNKPVFVDTRRPDLGMFIHANWMMPNVKEYESIIKENPHLSSPKDIIKHTHLDGLVLTKSEEGMEVYLPSGKSKHLEPTVKDVVDVTGAGDTAIATFAASICQGDSPKDAINFATYCAGIVCKKRGTATIDINNVRAYHGVYA